MATDYRLIDFVGRLKRCGTLDAAWEAYNREIRQYGVAHACYGFMPAAPRRTVTAEVLTFSSHRSDFTDAYMSAGHPDHDWSVDWSMRETAAQRWKAPDVLDALTPRQRETEELAYDYGLHEGLVVPLRGPVAASWGGVGLAAAGLDASEWGKVLSDSQSYLEAATQAFHETALANGYFNVFGLTAREREVLTLIASGATRQDIADRLSVSHRTAEVHTYRIRRKLRCVNDAQVAAKALVFNLVSP